MVVITKEHIKKLFKKVKKLAYPQDLETTSFQDLLYYSWVDTGSNTLYLVTDIRGKLEGIKFDITKPHGGFLRSDQCDVCMAQREKGQVALISGKVRYTPKNINYISRGKRVCLNFVTCNKDVVMNNKVSNLLSLVEMINN